MSANKILPFRFWCQKVLPLIYDDSLSYLEVLCKITAKLNELIESDNSQSDAIQELQTAVQELIEQESQVEADIVELKGRMETAENDIVGLSGRMGSAEDDILMLKSSVEGIVLSVDNIRTKLFTLTDNFASEYAKDVYYNAGQYCIYNDILYRCVENTPNPSGEFNPSKWERTKAGIEFVRLWDECSNIRLALDGLVVNFMGNLALPFSNYEGTTVTYNTGDLVTDYQWLYKCIQGYSFNEVVPTPANDRVHWRQTTIADNLSSGGGGGGDDSIIPPYDPARDYAMYELMERNGTTYMSKSHYVTIGTFVPSEWFEIPVKDVLRWSMFNAIGFNGLFDPSDVYPRGKLYGELFTDTDGRQCVSVQKVIDDWDGQGKPNSDAISLVEIMNQSLWVMSNYNRDTYDPTKTYNAGDIIINYAGRCMRCNTNGTTGTFDIGKWDDTNMFKELAEIKNAMINLNLYNGNVVDRYNTSVTEVI